MNRDDVNALCSALKGATAADPTTELDSWKVGDKMFACFGNPSAVRVSTKTDSGETAAMLIDAGVAIRAPYFHKSWVSVGFDADPEELAHRIRVSYDVILKSLPKKTRDAL